MSKQLVDQLTCGKCEHDEHGNKECMPRRAKDDIFCRCTGPQLCRTCKGDGLVMNLETGVFDVCNKCDSDGMVVG